MSRKYIDVSSHQGVIDFNKVKGQVDGVIIRAGYGRGNIDKTGCIYHVITKSFDGGTVFHQDSGDYRHNLLCRLCEERGITILFPVTMNNHTHDVLLVPDWEQLVAVYRILNLNVSKYLRRKYPRRF